MFHRRSQTNKEFPTVAPGSGYTAVCAWSTPTDKLPARQTMNEIIRDMRCGFHNEGSLAPRSDQNRSDMRFSESLDGDGHDSALETAYAAHGTASTRPQYVTAGRLIEPRGTPVSHGKQTGGERE